jgi:hypothetical protein
MNQADLLNGGLLLRKSIACDSIHTRLQRQPPHDPVLWLPTAYCAVAWQDQYLFATDLDFGLKVFGLDDPLYPNLIASLALPDDPFDLKLLGNRAYIAADQAGVIIVDIGNPQLPSVVSQFNVGGRSQKLAIVGTHLYVADHERGLRIFTLQDPDHPEEVGHFNWGRGVYCFSVHNSQVYACDTEYLMALDCSRALPVSNDAGPAQPYRFDLLANYPNPFNSSTIFRFQLPASTDATLTVYDVLGRTVWEYPLHSRNGGEGTVLWTGANRAGSFAASGTYFCQLTNRHESKAIKIQLLR